jgi:hypothetical protein
VNNLGKPRTTSGSGQGGIMEKIWMFIFALFILMGFEIRNRLIFEQISSLKTTTNKLTEEIIKLQDEMKKKQDILKKI